MMNRRTFLKHSVTASALLSAGCTLKRPKQSRPNILLIMADDMGYSDPGCTGGEIEMPHIDRLAKEGLLMTRFYNSSRCAPAHRCASAPGGYGTDDRRADVSGQQ
ncbi:MAG: sulfatase-like hydrolase/transferase [candidate division KSB1 bacterium]|nr:sulfatase-like hydrolase/transferase [candidate division KSB1 bacterium]